MKKFFGTKHNNLIYLDGEEAKHLAVLRCEVGETVLCYVADDLEYTTQISSISKKEVICEIISSKHCEGNPTKNIVVYQGLPKQDKLELISQKLSELGITKVIPFESNFTIAKPNENKIERLNKICVESAKQCGRSIPLVVEQPIKFNAMLNQLSNYDIVLFANETNKQITDIDFSNAKNIAIIVGSEGGFSANEIEQLINQNVTQCGLGSRILRTETASIVLGGIVSYLTKN